MYTICNLVFGVPITREFWEHCSKLNIEIDQDGLMEQYGFTFVYHGSLDYQSGWLGQSIASFSEIDPVNYNALLSNHLIDECRDNVKTLFNNLSQEIKDVYKAININVGLWFVWSSS